ncbi:PREDICTED: uncharacterized protein LOC108558156 [Nicrophorus vespilloides]|uniref:Cilia- and flagella-associated protein 126 n=1 Tax=Nicrophorus vespilloides TaxID=110193 RepID=A0ABM1M7B5_NICVS|nr:PREDICTED: uncharacterized protein LOC108558156 [Nicrophorus vespilloides]
MRRKDFVDEFEPKRLRNWQVPKWYPDAPIPRAGKTVVVSNDRGHLLPGIPRSQDNPWGNYVNTWNLPKKITREIANQLSAPNKIHVDSYRYRVKQYEKKKDYARKHKGFDGGDAISVSGDSVKEEHRSEKDCGCCGLCCMCLAKCKAQKAETRKSNEEQLEKIVDELASMQDEQVPLKDKPPRCPIHDKSPYNANYCFCVGIQSWICCINLYSEFVCIFECCKDLSYIPGALTDERHRLESHYGLQQSLRRCDEDKTSGRGFPVYRECFGSTIGSEDKEVIREMPKLDKVYLEAATNFELARELHKVNLEHEPLPDTVPNYYFRKMQMEHPDKHPGLAIKGKNYAAAVGYKPHSGYAPNRCTKMKVFRPKTSSTEASEVESVNLFDKKWRFIKQNKVRPIDLAIRWDMSPANPGDEPRRPKHIDGSNGSQAPAVFSMVHTPKTGQAEEISGNAEPLFERPKTTPVTRKEQEILGDKKCCMNRLCVACELKDLPVPRRPKEEYKMAFKAGTPNTRSSEGSQIYVKVPKQKEPYGKRSYTIKSLNAPFSLKKDRREDYPDHWRLASVYQHSYKPIHLRKKSLLQSVFQ